MRDLTTKPLTTEEEENIRECGAVGFTWQQLALCFDLDQNDVRQQFTNQRGIVYENYMQGRLQNELEIRQAVLRSAKNGSTPAQQQMMEYYSSADSDLRDLNQ